MSLRIIPATIALLALMLLTTSADAVFVFNNDIAGTNPNTANPFTAGQVVVPDLTVTGIGRGTGIAGSNANNRYNANDWNSASLNTNDYFTWTLSPSAGFELDLSSLVYSGQASGTGPTSFAFRSSLDNFTANIGTPTATGATITLGSPLYEDLITPIEFRLYAWGASSSNGTFSVNDFGFSGTVSAIAPVPEPTAALFGSLLAGAFGLMVARRPADRD